MPLHQKAPFNKTSEFTARRPFTYNGKRYAVGQKFDWRKIACSPRKLSNLYDGGFLLQDAKAEKKKKTKKADAPKAWKKPKEWKKPKTKKVEVEDKPEVKDDEDDAAIKDFLKDQD